MITVEGDRKMRTVSPPTSRGAEVNSPRATTHNGDLPVDLGALAIDVHGRAARHLCVKKAMRDTKSDVEQGAPDSCFNASRFVVRLRWIFDAGGRTD